MLRLHLYQTSRMGFTTTSDCIHTWRLHFQNKKVLLRERMRHTDRRVASPWVGRGGGYLPWPGGWGVPTLGVPPRCEQTENITFPHPSDAVGNQDGKDQRKTQTQTLTVNLLLVALPMVDPEGRKRMVDVKDSHRDIMTFVFLNPPPY